MTFGWSHVLAIVAIFLLPLLGCGFLGVGGSAGPGPGSSTPSFSQVGVEPGSVHVFPPTATPWPTFTPVPTPTVVPTRMPTRQPAPTATPWPRYFPGRVDPASSASGGSTLTAPYGKLHSGRVFLEKEALVVFWGGDLPDYLEDRDWDLMPESVKVVSSEIHYMLWVVAFDFTQAEPGYEMEGFIRWRSVPPGVQSIIMFEDQLTISAASPFFYRGLGDDDPGIWNPGFYRVEFLDDRYQVVVHADFEVR